MEPPSAPPASASSDDAYAPSSVIAEHYRVDRELGRGGMATVYLCTDLRNDQHVAIKVLRPELGSAVIIDRFLREISFASELDHPQIPKVLGSGVTDGVPYYVMTYVEGESLHKLIDREKQLPMAEALRIACEVIKPTAYAHKRGIVHRDLKPDNILIAKDGVYVLDFGISRAIIESGGDRLTDTGIGIGTPAYMSPEQALGDRNLDARSDIYSLGCVLYEMIAGIPPFVGPTAQVIISRRFAGNPPPLRELRDGVPETVEYAVERALAKSPADRWATADEFGAALNGCATGDLRFTTSSMRLSWWRRPQGRAAIATAGVGLIAALGLGWSAAYRDPFASAQREITVWNFNGAESELTRAIALRPQDPRAQLWLAQMRMLNGIQSEDWKQSALFASDHRAELTPTERARADALLGFASEEYSKSCAAFGNLRKAGQLNDAAEFTAVLSFGDCLYADHTVLADPKSPSGFRFATSLHFVDSLYEGLLERHRNSSSAYSVIIPRIQRVLQSHKGRIRDGSMAGDPRAFAAMPSLAADTLVYIPSPLPSSGPWRPTDEAGVPTAIARNRSRLRALGLRWSRAAPKDPMAHETLAGILEATGELEGGDISALDQIQQARSLAESGREDPDLRRFRQLRLVNTQVRLYVKLNRFDRAAALADTALALPLPENLNDNLEDSAGSLVSVLAALRGRISKVKELEAKEAAQQLIRTPAGATVTLPLALGRDYLAFSAHAAFGAPPDSLQIILARLDRNLTALLPADQVEGVRVGMYRRYLPVAAPALGAAIVAAELEMTGEPFVRALAAASKGQKERAKMILDSLARTRIGWAPGEVTMDIVYPESWLRAAIGDSTGAASALDNALRGLQAASPSVLRDDIILAACLVQVMKLRSELAAAAHQTDIAKTWGDAVTQLWGDGDPAVAASIRKPANHK